MIVYDKEQKQIVIPNGLGNVNIVINQGGDCPECPELTEISITENGRYEGAYNVVNVDVPTEGYGCNLISPIVFSKDAGNTINAKNVQIPTFVYEGNQYYNVGFLNLADIEEFKIQILFKSNNRGDSEPINIFGCENSEWDNTTFGARINRGFMEFKVVGNGRNAPFGVDTWYNVEMGYNTTKRWVVVNGSTLFEEEHTALNKPSQTLMIGAINSGGNAFRPFYGKIAVIYAEVDGNQIYLLPKEGGTMDAYWNDRNNRWLQISGDNNARFENDNISGDGMKSITWLGNLEDKSITPSMADRDDNNLIVVQKSEGYSGISRVIIDPQTLYNEGVEAGRAEGGGDCPEGGCTLVSRTFTSNGVYHPEAEQMQTIWFTSDKPSAYDTGIKLVDDSWVEIYFRATEGGDTPTLIGCEDSDWSNTTFATRWFDNNLGVKIGGDEISIPYTAGDDKLHKLKFGKTVGVWFDDAKVSDTYGGEWILTDRTIYIGAMNDPSNNNENGFWRPWVGYIGDVTVYGSLNENVGEYHFKAGDYGRGGEFKRVEDDTNLPNLGGEGMAIAQTQQYGEAPDGYNEIVVEVPDSNGDYNEGYEQGQADAAAKARVLNVTENGVYKSKFSDPIIPANYTVTGVYDDSTRFYSYAELNGKVFNTKIAGSVDSRLEFWYKGDNTLAGDAWNVIIGSGDNDDSDCFQVRYFIKFNNQLRIQVGSSTISVDNWDDTVWHHLIISKAEGLWIDGEKKGDFSLSNTINGEFFINGIGYDINSDKGGTRNANGTFGMVKIDDVVFIPTADGFQNVNTGELLEVVKDGTYTFTENLPIYAEGELYKTINVNVMPKINLQKTGLKFGQSTFTEVPEWADFEGITDMSHMFYECNSLETIPLIDTSNVTDMYGMFEGCSNLQTIPQLNTSNVTNMSAMFMFCNNLQTIPEIDTSNVTNMRFMFSMRAYQANHLSSLPKFNCQKVTNISDYFASNGMSSLTDVGGWENLKCNWNDAYGLVTCPNLTHQSCINILNGLYDFTGNGETPNSNQGKLKVHPNFLTTVGDEISIGVAKGWTITAE